MNNRQSDNRFAGLRPASLNHAEKRTVVDLALAILKDRHRKGRALKSPADTRDYLQLKLAERKNENLEELLHKLRMMSIASSSGRSG